MSNKPLYLTRHAVQRALKYNLSPEEIETIVREGERKSEGATKVRYVLRSKSNVWVAICEEYPDHIILITITRGR
jgi:hypothetical protein